MAPTKVICEINGSVWKIQVGEGDTVSEDDVLAILESMKMEIPVMSPAGGRIEKILVAEGETVAEGQDLMVITE